MLNNGVIKYYRQLIKCPFEITTQLVSSVISRPFGHSVGLYGFMYDFNKKYVCECNYDVTYNSSTLKINNNKFYHNDVNGDGIFDVSINNASYAYIKINNIKIPFEEIDNTYKLPPLTINTPLFCDLYEICTDGDTVDCKILWFNMNVSTEINQLIHKCDVDELKKYYLRVLSNRKLSKTKT
jgi:hypothetical protein